MSNYDKYFGTTEDTALIILKLSDGDINNEFSDQYCIGCCGESNRCTDEAMLRCILHWLNQEDKTELTISKAP